MQKELTLFNEQKKFKAAANIEAFFKLTSPAKKINLISQM